MAADVQARLFTGGRIFTSQPDDETLHEALVVQNGKVVFVGKEEHARRTLEEVSLCIEE